MNKICTSIEQSKKLLELGIDINTADMRYGYIAPYEYSDRMFDGGYDEVPYPKDFLKRNPNFSENEYDGELPAWSLAALLDVLPEGVIKNYYAPNLQKENGKYSIAYGNEVLLSIADNPVDACVELIEKLHKEGLL